MVFLEWMQNNWGVILQILGYLVAGGTAITGLVKSDKAEGAKAVLLKIAHILSAVSPIDKPGSLSVPLTTIDIKPKEPVT